MSAEMVAWKGVVLVVVVVNGAVEDEVGVMVESVVRGSECRSTITSRSFRVIESILLVLTSIVMKPGVERQRRGL